MIYDILITICFLVFIFVLYTTWNDNYWLKRNIPFIEPENFFGNIKDVVLMRRTIGQVYEEIYCKLGDKPLGGFFKLRQPILMVKHPRLIKDVLVDKFLCFQANDIRVRRDASPILKMNPVLATGAVWKSTKSVLSPLTKTSTLDGMMDIVKNISDDMVQYIKEQKASPLECKDLSSKYVSDVIAGCSLGLDSNAFKEANSKFREMSNRILKTTARRNIALLFALYAPDLANWFHFRIIPTKISNYFISLISEACKFRVRESVVKNDFLQHLININKESEANGEGTVYNYDVITGHCMTIFLDGYAMTMNPLYYCLYELAANKHVQQTLRKEIKDKDVTNIKDITQEKVKELEYLDMVVSETLRLHPSIQNITRICTRDVVLKHEGLDYAIDANTPVTIPVYALHMDPKIYEEPNLFNPERFSEVNQRVRNEYLYLPFGTGPRECPGAKFAKLIIKIAVISIILNYEITPRDANMELKQDPRSSLLNSAKGDIFLNFKELTA